MRLKKLAINAEKCGRDMMMSNNVKLYYVFFFYFWMVTKGHLDFRILPLC